MKKLNYNLISKYRGTLMGASIISIIIFHFVKDVSDHNTHYTFFYKAFNKFIGSSGVDIFLLLSGLGLYYSFKKSNDIKKFYKKRFVKILIPYFLICLPAILFRDLLSSNGDILMVIKDFTFITFFTKGSRWFWYILLIMFCYLIFPYFFKIFDEKQSEQSEQMRLLNIFTFFVVLALLLFNCNKLVFNRINIAFLRIPIFIFGIYLGKQSYNNRKIGLGSYLFFIIMSLLCLYLLKPHNIIIARFVLAFLAISYFSILVLFIDKFKNLFIIKVINTILSKIGDLIHVALRRVFLHFELYTYRIEYELLLLLITIILSIIINKIALFIEKRIIKV